MADKDKPKDKPKKGKLYKAARRDVMLALRPELNAIDREEARARDDYEEMLAQSGNIYDALLSQLAPLGPQYQTGAEAISSGLQTSLSDLANSIGLSAMDTAAPETAAALAAYGSVGSGGLSTLASQMARNLGYQTSAQRQGAIEREEVARNLMQELRDALEALSERRLSATDKLDQMILQRLDQLREQRLTQQLAQSQMASDEAFSQFLQGQIGSMLGSSVRPSRTDRGTDTTDRGTDTEQGYNTPSETRPARTETEAEPERVPPIVQRWLMSQDVQPRRRSASWSDLWEGLTPKQRRRLRRLGYFPGNPPGVGTMTGPMPGVGPTSPDYPWSFGYDPYAGAPYYGYDPYAAYR